MPDSHSALSVCLADRTTWYVNNPSFDRPVLETLRFVRHEPRVGILVVFGPGPKRPSADVADKKGSAGKRMPSTGATFAAHILGRVHRHVAVEGRL